MKTARSGPRPVQLELGLEAVQLAPEGVAARGHVEQSEVAAVEHDEAGAGAEHRASAANELAKRLGEALSLDAEGHRGGFAAGYDEAVEPLEVLRRPHDPRLGPNLTERACVCLEVALDGEDADDRVGHLDYQPRFCSRPPSACSVPISMPGMASPSSRDAAATRSGSS